MFESLQDKKVLITGASGGMGESIAELFAEYGAELGLHYNTNEQYASDVLRKVNERGIQAELFKADLTHRDECSKLIQSFVSRFGSLDILINNAGAAYEYTHFSELEESAWGKTFDLNTKAPFYLIGEALFVMKKKKQGRIINISSVNVKYGGGPKSFHYIASKAALEALTIGFAKEGAQDNVLVNAIRCGVIDTPMRTKTSGYSEKDFQKRIDLVPLKRAGTPLDVARMALFLAAESGDFITGEIFTVAGGD